MKGFLLFMFPVLLFGCEKDPTPEPVNKTPPVEKSPQETEGAEEATGEDNEEDGPLSYLALGDSYTIGQNVAENERWPVILTAQLREAGIIIEDPEIIARTGWTTENLQSGIAASDLSAPYDLVSLLIGVNNQYQGKSLSEYQNEFSSLLATSIKLAGGKKENVFVLSIPDYSVTPFASGSNQTKIKEELRLFNAANKRISEEAGVRYFDITPISQKAEDDPELLAADQLHPSGKMYTQWVDLIFADVLEMARE